MAATGLVPLRGELRVARMGPFRSAVYFAASGEPTKLSLDDGTWNASEARLTPAEPPARRQPTRSASRSPRPGASLLAGSTWAGPHRQPSAGATEGAILGGGQRPQRAGSRAPVVPTPAPNPNRRLDFPALPSAVQPPSQPSQLAGRRRGGGGRQPAASLEDRIDSMLEQMGVLQKQNAELLLQLSRLQEENAVLRRRLAAGAPMVNQP